MRYSHGELVQLAEEGRRKKMDELISRQEALDLWDKYHPYIATKAMEYDRKLRALQTAQSERKKGRWIDRGRISQCSECERFCMIETSFCPNCGADMRGERDAEIH